MVQLSKWRLKEAEEVALNCRVCVCVCEHTSCIVHLKPCTPQGSPVCHILWWSITSCSCRKQLCPGTPGSVVKQPHGGRFVSEVMTWCPAREEGCGETQIASKSSEAAWETSRVCRGTDQEPVALFTGEKLERHKSITVLEKLLPGHAWLCQQSSAGECGNLAPQVLPFFWSFSDKKKEFLNCSAVIMNGWRGQWWNGVQPHPTLQSFLHIRTLGLWTSVGSHSSDLRQEGCHSYFNSLVLSFFFFFNIHVFNNRASKYVIKNLQNEIKI